MLNAQDESSSTQIWLVPLVWFLIVCISLAVFVSQNPSSVLPRTTMYFDASHYLETCKRLYETCGSFFSGTLTKGELDALAFYLLLDGPVLPGAGAIVFWLLHKAPALTEWQSLVWMQCFAQAMCSGFVYLLARTLVRREWLAVLAALLWTTYPAAISSCNSFLTEPLACMFSVGLVYLITGLNSGPLEAGGTPALPGLEDDGTPSPPVLEDNGTPALRGLEAGSITSRTGWQRLWAHLKSWKAGGYFALLVLLKPALAPAAGLATVACMATNLCKRSFRQAILSMLFIAGVAIIFAPWLMFSYSAHGTFTLLPSRRPIYNITTGCNIEGDGWGCYPTHPVALMYDDNEPALPVALALIEANPGEIANLGLRKITRLWNLPWNDYRYKILGLSYRAQSVYHMLLVGLGLAGLICMIAASLPKGRFAPAQNLTVAAIIFMVAGHLIYLPFEGISRYGFTAMPFIVIGAAFMIGQLIDNRARRLSIGLFAIALAGFVALSKIDLLPLFMRLFYTADTPLLVCAVARSTTVLLMAAAVWNLLRGNSESKLFKYTVTGLLSLLVMLAVAITTAFAISDRESHAWHCNLKANDKASRSVMVSIPEGRKPDWALFMIDGDQNVSEAKFSINDTPLQGRPESIYQFYTRKYELEDWLTQFASLIRKSPDSLRKWRALSVPLDSIKGGSNTLSITQANNKGSCTIYGDYNQSHASKVRLLPSPDEVSPGKFFNDSEEGFDSRIIQTTYSVFSQSTSTLERDGKKTDISTAKGPISGDFRMFLLLGYNHTPSAESIKTNPKYVKFKRALSSGPSPSAPVLLKAAEAATSPQLKIALPPQCLTGTHIRVHVTGKARSNASSTFSVAGVTEQKDRLLASVLPGTPQLINTGSNWCSFSVQSDLPVITVGTKDPAITIQLRPVTSDTELVKLEVELEPIDKPQFSAHSIKVF